MNVINVIPFAFQGTTYVTDKSGCPVPQEGVLMTVGRYGPALLQDIHIVDVLSSFTRERVPERVVHAKGAGAFGYFEVTHDITKYTGAKVFETIGKRTPVAARFSTVAGEVGSADTVRDPRGFAIKFYSEDGNWDLVGNNTPIFFIRDPTLFPSFVHSQKRNPVTHLKDPDMFWDFISLRPECAHQTVYTFGDRGIPDGYRHMHGFSSHTYKFVNDKGVAHWCKFHWKTNQGIKNLTVERADELALKDPDYAIRDLFNAIAKGDYPSWNLHIQIMTLEQAEKSKFNPFDLTKIWPQGQYPLIPVGKMVLDRNPKNYFTDVEQIAMSPSNFIPGIEASPDKMLQGRLFAYNDTHRHRIGANYLQLPVNCPYRTKVANYQRDGPQAFANQEGAPNYYPNSFSGPQDNPRAKRLESKYVLNGEVGRYEEVANDSDYEQANVLYSRVMDAAERKRLVENVVGHLKDASSFIQERTVKMFAKVNPELGRQISEGLKKKSQSNL